MEFLLFLGVWCKPFQDGHVNEYDRPPLAGLSSHASLQHLQIDTSSARVYTQILEVLVSSRSRAMVYFMCAVIGVFTIGDIISIVSRRSKSRTNGNPAWQKGLAAGRFLSYRSFYLCGLRWYSPSLGVVNWVKRILQS